MLSFIQTSMIPDVVNLLRKFHEETKYYGEFNQDKVRDMIELFQSDISKFMVAVWLVDNIPVGIVAGQVSEYLWVNAKVTNEVAWYVLPEYKKGKGLLALLDAYEYWAEHIVKADVVMLGHLNTPKVGKFYEKRGYVKKEESYIRRVN